jgi:hypothetical protein
MLMYLELWLHLLILIFTRFIFNTAKIPGLDWITDVHGGQYRPLINGYLPVITLLGLILLLPIIFKWVAEAYEKRKTFSGVEDSVANRYFYYQLANIYITVTAGALWTSLAEIIDHPQQLLLILGETLPKLAGYFISLLITKTLAGLPMVLLRIGALSRMMFLRSCFNKKRLTQRELNEVYRKQPILYGWEVRFTSFYHPFATGKANTYFLFCSTLTVSNTIPCHYHMFYVCMYYSHYSSCG